jgi:hypothetical protein
MKNITEELLFSNHSSFLNELKEEFRSQFNTPRPYLNTTHNLTGNLFDMKMNRSKMGIYTGGNIGEDLELWIKLSLIAEDL